MTSTLDQSPSTPTKPLKNVEKSNMNGSTNHNDILNQNGNSKLNTKSQNDKVLAATNDLADLFLDDEEIEEPKPKTETNGHETNGHRNHTITNSEGECFENGTNGRKSVDVETSFAKSKKNSPNSLVDLYGCDEMSPPVEQNGTGLSNKTLPKSTNHFSNNNSINVNNDLANISSAPQNPKLSKANSISYTNDNNCISQSLYSSFSNSSQANSTNGLNINENLLSQIMTGSNSANQQTNYSNVNYLMRRERSLDRAPVTENFMDNFLLSPANNMRRSYVANSNQSSQNNSTSLYSNANTLNNGQGNKLQRQSNQQQAPHQHHHRSNSILNTNSITSANPLTNLNNSNFNRDYGNGVIMGNGLRSSARALSSTSFSTQNFQRDPSASSLKSLGTGTHGSSNNLNDITCNNTPINGSSSKLNFIKDLQIRLMDMQKECYYLRCELDSTQQKLTSSMQSIKQFWSPELKRERMQRKEESSKYSILLEQYKLLQGQYQTIFENYEHQSINYQQLQMQLDQQNGNSEPNLMTNKQLLREKSLLKKTINELEMRINTQKQSLNTKDETIKKLFHLVKSATSKIKNNDAYATTSDTAQHMNDIDSLTTQLEASNANNIAINEQHNLLRERLQEEERKSEQLKQVVQQLQQQKPTSYDNDSHVKHLESQIKSLQDELNLTKNSMQRSIHNLSNENCENSSGIQSSHVSPQHSSKQGSLSNNISTTSQFDLLKANEKFLKEKIETYKSDLSRKETELQQLKTKFETCESKEKDQMHYLNLLKESITTKDQQITMQQSEINDLRVRIRDKETFIEKKNQQLQTIQLEKHQRDSDIGELRDQMDIKERKINVLNRKIENLEDQLKDKEMQITTIRSKLSNSTVGSGTMYHANLMKTLDQKEKIIEKLTKDAIAYEKQCQSQNESRDGELNEQNEQLNTKIKELNEKIDVKNKEIENNQNEIYDLKDELEMLKTQLLRKDSHVNSLELSLTQKNEEIEMIEEKLDRLTKQQQQQLLVAANNANQQNNNSQIEIENLKKQINLLQKDVSVKETQIQNLTNELKSLKEIIDEFEEQKKTMKSRFEQQQTQFSQLEKLLETRTSEFEDKLKEQKIMNNHEIDVHEKNKTEALKEQQRLFQEELIEREKQMEELKKRLSENKIQTTTDSSDVNERIENLTREIGIIEKEKAAKEDQIKNLNERINQLEEALRESVSITAEREIVFDQQKKKNESIEEDNKNLNEEIKKMQKSLYEQQCEFNRYQEEFAKREDQLQKLEEEKVEEMNQFLVNKQEQLLSSISEKDAQIGSLEYDRTSETKGNKARIQQLNEEKDHLHQQLKDLNEKRMKLMQDHMTAKEAKHKIKLLTLNNHSAHDVDGITG